jgi:hypothetical protein
MSRRSVRLDVEVLEERAVPSGTGAAGSMVPSDVVHSSYIPHQTHAMVGRGTGTYIFDSIVVDSGFTYQFSGNGHFGQLGDAAISGSIQSVGMIQQGRAHGTLTFTNAHGSVTLTVDGPIQPGFGPMPIWFTYRVTQASGSFKNLQDHGTLRIDYHQYPFVMDANGHPAPTYPGETMGGFRLAI